jgi:hypothetical protein
MVDREQARSLVAAHLAAMPPASPGDGYVILDEHTIERDWGWVFFYNSRKYVETGDYSDALLGNAPYIVRRSDGALFVTGTVYPIGEYIADFEAGKRLVVRVE